MPTGIEATGRLRAGIEATGRLRDLIGRRRLGITRRSVMAGLWSAKKSGALVSIKGLEGEDLEAARAENAEAIAFEIIGSNAAAWTALAGEGRDWAAFFEALMDFIERLMPFLEMFLLFI